MKESDSASRVADHRPDIDWVGLAKSLGVPGARVTDMEGFNRRFAEGLATPGPYLVEVVL